MDRMDLIDEHRAILTNRLQRAIYGLNGGLSDEERDRRLQEACDALHKAGYVPTGWVVPPRLK